MKNRLFDHILVIISLCLVGIVFLLQGSPGHIKYNESWQIVTVAILATTTLLILFLYLMRNVLLQNNKTSKKTLSALVFIGIIVSLLGSLAAHFTYRENSLFIAPGEAIRWNADKIIPIYKYKLGWAGVSINNEKDLEKVVNDLLAKKISISNSNELMRMVSESLAIKIPKDSKELYTSLIRRESLLMAIFIEKAQNFASLKNLYISDYEKSFYKNTEKLVDLFSKKAEQIRSQEKINLKKWQRLYHQFGTWLAGRLFFAPGAPDQGALMSIDRLIMNVDAKKENLLDWHFSVSLSGQRQRSFSQGESFSMMPAYNANVEVVDLLNWANLTIGSKKNQKEVLILKQDDHPKLSDAKNPVTILSIASGIYNHKGFVETSYRDEHNKSQVVADTIFIDSKKKNIKLDLGKQKISPYAFIQLVMYQKKFTWFFSVGLIITLIAFSASIYDSRRKQL